MRECYLIYFEITLKWHFKVYMKLSKTSLFQPLSDLEFKEKDKD